MAPTITLLPFGSFHSDLDTVATAIFNKLKLQWPKKWIPDEGASTLLRANVIISQNTYRTVVYICTECADCGWRLEFTLSCTPLTRTILDTLFATVFLLEDLRARTIRFYKGGWRETREELDRYKTTYGTTPDWQDWLRGMEQLVDGFKWEVGITPAEESAIQVERWLLSAKILGRME